MAVAVLVCGLALYLARRPNDAVTVLVLGLLISFVFPQRFVVDGLDTAGAPSLIIGVALLALWAFGRLRPLHPLDPRPDMTPILAGLYLSAWLLEFALEGLRPNPGASPDATLREFIQVGAILGVLLYTSDALRTQRDLERLLRTVTLLGAGIALLGIVQFLLGSDPLNGLDIPLLAEAETQNSLRVRAGFIRVRGTAWHPIEFSVVLAMLLPLAIGFSLMSERQATRRFYAVCAAGMGIAAILSVSRSAIVALAASLAVVALHVNWPQRARIAAGAFIGLVLVYLLVPGLLGTFRRLIFRTENDPSIVDRINDIPYVLDIFRRSPLVGDGAPGVEAAGRLLDNEYYERIVSTGLLGLSTLLILLFVPLVLAWMRSQIGSDTGARTQAAMITASLTAATISLATFDGFFFRLFTTVLLVLVAAACAAWRLRSEDPVALETAPQRKRVSDARYRATTRSDAQSR